MLRWIARSARDVNCGAEGALFSSIEQGTARSTSLLHRFARHRHKAHRFDRALLELTVFLFQKIKFLITETPDRNDHATAFFQLIDKRLGHVIGRARNNDLIKWRVLGPASVTVALFHMHIFVAETFERGLCCFRE